MGVPGSEPTTATATEKEDSIGDLLVPKALSKKAKKSKSKKVTLNDSEASLSLESQASATSVESRTNQKKKKKKRSGLAAKSKATKSETGFLPEETIKRKDGSDEPEELLFTEDAEDILSIVTQDMWVSEKSMAKKALEALYDLLKHENGNFEANRKIAIRAGGHLLVVRKMKEFPSDDDVQECGLKLLQCWGDMQLTTTWSSLVMVGGVQQVVLIAKKTESQSLCLLALKLLNSMADGPESAKLLVQANGVDALVHVLRFATKELSTQALETLHKLGKVEGGHEGRKRIAEQTNALIQNTEDSKLLAAAMSLLNDLTVDVASTLSLVQGNGVEALAYALTHMQNKPYILKKTFETVAALCQNGGSGGRQAVVDHNIHLTIAQIMKEMPENRDVQKGACQIMVGLAEDFQKAIKEAGILTLISKIFATHRDQKDLLKIAHTAMDAVVS